MTELHDKHCQVCEGGTPRLTKEQAEKLLCKTPHWTLHEDHGQISREFNFKGFMRTMSFVNAVAWVANQQGHHPDMNVGYNYCHINYSTHAVD